MNVCGTHRSDRLWPIEVLKDAVVFKAAEARHATESLKNQYIMQQNKGHQLQ